MVRSDEGDCGAVAALPADDQRLGADLGGPPVPLTSTARRTPSKLTYWRTLYSLRLNLGRLVLDLFHGQFGGLACHLAHLGDDGAELPVVGDPLLVELGFALAESTGD